MRLSVCCRERPCACVQITSKVVTVRKKKASSSLAGMWIDKGNTTAGIGGKILEIQTILELLGISS